MFLGKKTPADEKAKEFQRLLKERDVRKRLSVIPSLVEAGSISPQIFPVLVKDGDVRVRTSAAMAISAIISKSKELREDFIEQAVEFFMHKDLRMQFFAAGLLGRVAASSPESLVRSMPRILSLFKEKELSLYVRPRAFAVGNIGCKAPELVEDLVPTITPLLKEQDQVIIALEHISARHPLLFKDCTPQLVDIIKNCTMKTFSASWDAAVVLARLSTSSAGLGQLVRTRMEGMMRENNVLARAFATYVIGELGLRNPEIVMEILPNLVERLEDEPDVRWFATLALGRIGSESPDLAERVTPELLKMLRDVEPLVRGAATVSLRYIALSSPGLVKGILPSLSEMLQDKHPTIRGIAAIGLKLISLVTPDIISDVAEAVSDVSREENADARRGAATAFHHISRLYESRIDRDLVPQIVQLLGDEEPRIRDRVVMAIKNIAAICPEDAKDCIPGIVELLKDKENIIRRDAAYALHEFSDKYPEVVKELALIKLVELLEDKDMDVQSFAGLALGKIM